MNELMLITFGIMFIVLLIICVRNFLKKRDKSLNENNEFESTNSETYEQNETENIAESEAEINTNEVEKVISKEDAEAKNNIDVQEDKLHKLAENVTIKNENRNKKQENRAKKFEKKNTKRISEPENPGHRAGRAKKKKYALEMLKYYKINYRYAGESERIVFVENKFKLNLETLEYMNLITKYKEKGMKRLLYRLKIPGIERTRGVHKNG